MRIRSVLIVTFVTVASLPPCAAQVEFTPWTGYYLPSAQLRQDFGWGCAAIADANGVEVPDVETPPRQQSAVAVGARITTWVSKRLGLEGSLGYAPSGWSASGCYTTVTGSSHVTTGSLRVLLRLAPHAKTGPYLLGGFVVVDRAGEAYQVGSTVNSGGVAGIGLRTFMTRLLVISAQVEAYLFPAVFGANGGQFQHDFLLSLGLSVPLSHR
jgi:hypothetical protein